MKRLSRTLGVFCILALSASSSAAEPVLGHFKNTHYYVALESGYAEQIPDTAVETLDDEVIAMVPHRFKIAMDIEGTGRLLNGRVVNFAGVKDKRVRYHLSGNLYGDGVGACALIPFHTLAADPRILPLGSVVRIDETVGMRLPDGTLHDGIWRVEDIGGAIKGYRIDLFVGDGNQGEVLRRQGIGHMQPLTLRLVSPPQADSCVNR